MVSTHKYKKKSFLGQIVFDFFTIHNLVAGLGQSIGYKKMSAMAPQGGMADG